jgi:spore coat protein U-like protein
MNSIRDSSIQVPPARGLRARLRRMIPADDSAILWLRLWRGLAVLVLMVGFASLARAQSCTVTAVTLAFGQYDPVGTHAATPAQSTSQARVSCPGENNVTVTMGISAGASGNPYDRRMVNPGGGLRYNVYRDPNHAQLYLPLGQAGGNAVCATRPGNQAPTCTGTQEAVVFHVFGLAPAAQEPGAGRHEDTLIVEIAF